MLEQKAGLTPTTDVPLIIEKDIESLPPMEEVIFEKKDEKKDEPVVGSALKQDGSTLNLVKRKRKKKKSTIPEIARKRYKQRKGIESDSSFDSSDSAYDDDDDDDVETKPQRSVPEPEEEEQKGPTHLEQIVEATKSIVAPIPKRVEEEYDDLKVQLLKSNREGDLSKDEVKVEWPRVYDDAFIHFCVYSPSTSMSTENQRFKKHVYSYLFVEKNK